MFVIDSRDTLSFAREHARRLGDDAAGAQTRKRRSLVTWLRRHACRCRVDRTPLVQRPA